MSQFRKELRVIPRTVWIIALVLLLMIPTAAIVLTAVGVKDPWFIPFLPLTATLILLSIYVLLVGYVNGDARRRGMRYVVWTLLAIFVPNAIGIILYFLLREQLQRPCPSCGAGYKLGLAYCPHCGTAVGRICPECKRPIEESWKNCAHCGVPVSM